MNNRITEDDRWHLDKKVPIALIVALIMQAATTVWFGSKLDSRIAMLEDSRLVQHVVDDKQDKLTGDAITLLRSDIHDVGAKVDRLFERERK